MYIIIVLVVYTFNIEYRIRGIYIRIFIMYSFLQLGNAYNSTKNVCSRSRR